MGLQKPSKMSKITKNWVFSGCHGYGFNFFNLFSFDPGRAWLDGHFGVLHDLLYAPIDAWDSQKPSKMAKITQKWSFSGCHGY